jgi:hypothetical protein
MVALVCVGVLAGCGVVPDDPTGVSTMKPLEAKAEIVALLDEVKAAYPVEWEEGGAGPMPCGVTTNVPGVRFVRSISAEGLSAAEGEPIIDAVATAWARSGFEAVRSTSPEYKGIVVEHLNYPAAGTGADPTGLGLSLSVGPNSVHADAQSRCVPDDD